MPNTDTPLSDSPVSSRRSSMNSKGRCETPASSILSPSLSPSDAAKYTEVTQEPSIEVNVNTVRCAKGGNCNDLQEANHENVFGEPLKRLDTIHILLFLVIFITFKGAYAVLLGLCMACLLAMLFTCNVPVTTMPKAQAVAIAVSANIISNDATSLLHTEFPSIDTNSLFPCDNTPKSKKKLDNATKVICGLKKELQAKKFKILGQEKLIGLKDNRIKAKENRLRSNKMATASQTEKIGQLEAELSSKVNEIEQIGSELHEATRKPTDDDLELWPFMKSLKESRTPTKSLNQLIPDIFKKLGSLRPEYKEHTDVSLGTALKEMLARVVCTIEANGQDSDAPIPVDTMEKALAKYTHTKPWNKIIDASITKVRFQKPMDFQTLGQYRKEYLNAQQYEKFATLPTPNKGSQATKTGYNKGMSILDSRYLWVETNVKHLYVGLVEDYIDDDDPSKGFKRQGVWAVWTGTSYKVFFWIPDQQIWHCETDEISICIEEDMVKVLKGNRHDPENPPLGPRVWTCSETGPFWDRVSIECHQQWVSEQERRRKEYEDMLRRDFVSYHRNMHRAREQAKDDIMARNVNSLVDDDDDFF